MDALEGFAGPLTKRTKGREEENARNRTWRATPVLSSEFTQDSPLQDAYVGILKEKRNISKAIQSISNILPGLPHLKRCSNTRLLLTTLAYSKELEDTDKSDKDNILSQVELKELLRNKEFDLSLLEDEFQVIKIPKNPPRTKSQAANSAKTWPVNFHPDPGIEAVISGSIFDQDQLDSIEAYMKIVIEAAKLEAIGNDNCHGSSLVVDPEDGRVLAIAASKVDLHPMWHAAMIAIDLVARLQGGGTWNFCKSTENKNEISPKLKSTSIGTEIKDGIKAKRKFYEDTPVCFPESLRSIPLPESKPLWIKAKNKRKDDGSCNMESQEKIGPYLCTGYWVFLLREPCAMCAMALLHSRVIRIFYGIASEGSGVLGSKAILHSVPGLNHRYQVWKDVLEQECQEAWSEIISRDSS
ncbi:probable inactive tRNA-specific adenosine deaminase-like protein 3 isoform X2 [Cephus cinctus]|nr:probable inactive tRNA-specific adenosine deaminase-like protein 3 isoform X2 [Cephus cinctus]XP_024947104.1 probable inactive tRNA-specific adenosine deaminase-like protein 3 isoform X2 [Cephus cinctus]XP_024947105.1 probable inactive tRNA-specific adenosine deaminase-like protein 3 isoform X2 [Cephus cinctus]XP_024947106.1 probable inactive tRNA-specific adenosine deaminase-like protein 3 isoform X2 [Cephus cinctus]XP_024947107.1 probable inactive tRNA-specific adenosine deaminase-like pro